MRRLVGPLVLTMALGCDGAAPPTADVERDRPDSLLRDVELYAFAVNHRDHALYVSTLTDDFETVNDEGGCLDWLHPAYWDSTQPDVCGLSFVGLELIVTSERLLKASAVEVVTSVTFRRATAESTGAYSDHAMVFTLKPTNEGYKIQRVQVRDPFAEGT